MRVLLLIAASVCLISVGGKKELAVADLQAWQALYDATGGNDTWTRCAKYRDNPCKCPRVECPYTHIETIDLGDSGLQGERGWEGRSTQKHIEFLQQVSPPPPPPSAQPAIICCLPLQTTS